MSEIPQIPFNKDLTYLGVTTYRDKNTLFGIKRKDRRQHVYILGKSGTGKSVLMFNMIAQNIYNGEGVCVVDPHGELVEGVLSAIPPHRMKDVVYFNPADTDYHIGFNVLELVDHKYKHLVASGLMGIFTKIWANAWSARMEYILNNAILALLDTPGTTLLGIPRMLVDKDYRQKIINNLKDPVIKAFWVHEYEAWQDKFRNEAIAPIQNKVGQFLSTSIIRNVVGQSQSTINIFDIMNEGKIFLVNVSKGRIGEDNSGLLGGMIITKVQLAAMERVRIPEDERKDFYLYVDEFQNFVTDAFAGILSEARKYRLNLTVAHQYTAQLVADKSSAVRDAVFGNVGTMIVFRVGADDADFLEAEFEPEFVPQDIVNLPNYKIYLKLMIDGVTSRPFSAKTLPPMFKSGIKEVEEQVIRSSRALYCRPREVIEKEIADWSGMSLGDVGASTGGGNFTGEKFPAICSSCKKETTVPFKPEPGRPVYCKDCVEKIKSGEIKPVSGGSLKEMKQQEDSRMYGPLAALGIEFSEKDAGGSSPSSSKPQGSGMLGAVKKIFKSEPAPRQNTSEQKPRPPKENFALRDALSKIDLKPAEIPVPPPVSLNALRTPPAQGGKTNTIISPKDRGAPPEEMNKLKSFIEEKKIEPQPKIEDTFAVPKIVPILPPEMIIPPPKQPRIETPPEPQVKTEQPPVKAPKSSPSFFNIEPIPAKPAPMPIPPVKPQSTPPLTAQNVKEVPEDVLRKILEG